MKARLTFLRHGTPLLVWALLGQVALRAAASQPAAPDKTAASSAAESSRVVPEIPRSVFLTSSPTQDLRDPFFPDSTRFAAMAPVKTNATGSAVVRMATDLVLKGLSGRVDAPLATINDVVFGLGEVREVETATGRVRVRCVSINTEEETVVIEAAGQQRELRFPRQR